MFAVGYIVLVECQQYPRHVQHLTGWDPQIFVAQILQHITILGH